MKKYIYVLLLLLVLPYTTIGQKANTLIFKDLKKVNCEGVNESSSQKKRLQCFMVDVVQDNINYFSSMSQKSDFPITTPEMAWEVLRKLYPEYEENQFSCWAEYSGYYCFSLDCGDGYKNKGKCSFICMIYIQIGGNEFRYFVPRT